MSTENRQPSSHELTALQWELLHELRHNSSRAVMLHQMIADRLGLNATDHKCLDYLNRSGPVTAGQLAELTGLTTGAITNVIDRLEQAGYVIRDKDPNDRRRVVVKPAPAATGHMSPLFESLFQSTLALVSRYSEQDARLIVDFLQQCNAIALEEMNKLKEQRP
ncbi:hypothetical protein PAESOLCIP111_03633 [Paenibacillus solanacearum]|uniref:HTH marR-type domain-containing protein n=1 Tax=Paenibacillus solanacearum TaxID=2048548 RepID=A0A916NJY9_9BACL|nr:MarR family transcriptional regulator [Paenibacillus solanacearum]CAG7635171.1 hypothetical protein PAESOLCIP111_03633 [Paenibacillus solanacearum]